MPILLYYWSCTIFKIPLLTSQKTHLHSHIGNNCLCKTIVYTEFQYIIRHFIQFYQDYII